MFLFNFSEKTLALILFLFLLLILKLCLIVSIVLEVWARICPSIQTLIFLTEAADFHRLELWNLWLLITQTSKENIIVFVCVHWALWWLSVGDVVALTQWVTGDVVRERQRWCRTDSCLSIVRVLHDLTADPVGSYAAKHDLLLELMDFMSHVSTRKMFTACHWLDWHVWLRLQQ